MAMLSRVWLVCSLLVDLASSYSPPSAVGDPEWEHFKARYKKTYKDSDDEAARHSLFKVAKARVAELNKLNGDAGHAFGINWMSDRPLAPRVPPWPLRRHARPSRPQV